MSRGRAPTAMRTPISRVRSVTDTSMMFMMPTPPTISEMKAIEASIKVMVPVMIPSTLAISVVFCTKKSGCSPNGIRCRSNSSCLISLSAVLITPVDRADTRIACTSSKLEP